MKCDTGKKRVVCVIPTIVGGGAEKVLVNLINFLDQRKYDLFLVIFEKKGADLSVVADGVVVHDLGKKSRYDLPGIFFRLVVLFYKIKPDIVLSFMSFPNIMSIFARGMVKHRIKLIATEHSYLSTSLKKDTYAQIKAYLYKHFYHFADICIVPSRGVKEDLIKEFNLSPSQVVVIPNPVNLAQIDEIKNESVGMGKYILSVGRLSPEKGYPDLLKAYSLIYRDVEENLVILGTGKMEASLKLLARELGVAERVLFLGYQANPYKFMKDASVFVLSSLWESFSLVILEAMACGVPVISTDCPSGPREIITHGVNGILIRPADQEGLAKAMIDLLRDTELRKKFAGAGRKRAQDFNIDRILPEYEKLF